VLRAAAIVMMVVVHFVENLSGSYAGANGPFEGVHRVWWMPTGFAAPTFAFLSGVSYSLWLDGQRRRGRSDVSIAKSTIRRGLFLVGLGFTFNVFVWLPEDVFNWDILTLIGCGLLTLDAARRMPSPVVVLTAVLVVASAPLMRDVAGYGASWTEGYYDYEFTLPDVVLGWLVNGYFPVFPWLAFPLLGFAAGPSLLVAPRKVMAIGCGLVAASAAVILSWPALPIVITDGEADPWTMFPASMAYVFGTLGGVCIAMTSLHRLLDGDVPRGRWLVAWATPLSSHSLSIYLVHHVIHVWPLWMYGLATTGDATAHWQVAMPAWMSLSLAVVSVVAAAVLCRQVDRWQIPTAESLMRWLCD
jgi:uncharacterized membrane protein